MSVFREDIGRRKSLYRLALARNDIQTAREIAGYAEKNVSEFNELWIPLTDALAAAYARPFTSNKPYGPLPNRWSKFEDRRHQQLHDELIQMRHELVAHTDASQRRVIVFSPGTLPPVPDREPSKMVTLAVLHKRHPPSFFASARELSETLLAHIHVAVEDELSALFGGIGPIQPFDLLTGQAQAIPSGTVLISQSQMPKPQNPGE